MRQLSELRDTVGLWRGLEQDASHLEELFVLSEEENDRDFQRQLASEAADLDGTLNQLELQLAFRGEHDRRNAILSIHAGAGGTESQDWAEMLLRMFLRP